MGKTETRNPLDTPSRTRSWARGRGGKGDSSGPLPATVPRPRGCSYRPGMPGYELSLPACLRWTVSRAVSLEKISSPLWATARPKFSW